jgi:hypothetical protein
VPDDRDQYLVLGRDVNEWDRLENLAEVRAYEGGAAYIGDLDGRPCFAVNGAALDWGDDDMTGWNHTPIYQFETVAARDARTRRAAARLSPPARLPGSRQVRGRWPRRALRLRPCLRLLSADPMRVGLTA